MNQECQAGFAQLLSHAQSTFRTNAIKGLLEIYLTATSGEARDSFGIERGHDTVARPSRTEHLWTHEHVIPVIGVIDVCGGDSCAQPRHPGEGVRQHFGMVPALLNL